VLGSDCDYDVEQQGGTRGRAVRRPNDRPLVTGDIERLHELTSGQQAPFSELCAANLYLFRDVHAYRLSLEETVYVRGITYDGMPHLAPLARLDDDALAALSLRSGLPLYPLAPRAGWRSSCNPDDSDYVFNASDLADYKGAVRKAPRRMRRRFRRECQPRDEPFTPERTADALAVLDAWLDDVGKPWAATDYGACREAFTLFEPLGLKGLVTFTGDGDPAGFLLGSPLGDGSLAIHFAKGKRRYPGVFPHLFSRFAEVEGHRFPRLNFEQDLGKPGFRQAKRSHGPSGLLHKHRLHPPVGAQDRPG
jgi:uncharacterized protein